MEVDSLGILAERRVSYWQGSVLSAAFLDKEEVDPIIVFCCLNHKKPLDISKCCGNNTERKECEEKDDANIVECDVNFRLTLNCENFICS